MDPGGIGLSVMTFENLKFLNTFAYTVLQSLITSIWSAQSYRDH